jgi:uncharacterized protein YneF (UPF0154 family)
MSLTWEIISIVAALLVGGIAGFFIAQAYLKRYLAKNPPINEDMIRAMMSSMGRKPSEKQVRQVMQSMNQAKK